MTLSEDLLKRSGIKSTEQVPEDFPRVLTQVTQNLQRLHRKGELSDGALFLFGFSMIWQAMEDLTPTERRSKFLEMGELFLQQHEGNDGQQGKPSVPAP